MQESDLPGLAAQVLWAAFFLAAVFGAIAQRTHFCTMGAVADIVNIGDWSRMRMWALAIGVAMLGFNTMVYLGWVEAGKSIYASSRLIWLSNLLGGALFGVGMVLASGCGSKTLVRIGGGSLKALVVFAVLAIAAYATMRGIVGVARVATVDTVALTRPTGQDLPSLLAAGSADVLMAGFGIGLVVVGVWWVSGRLGHLPEHPQTLEEAFLATNSQRMESLTFVAPIAYTVDWLILFSDKSKVLTIAVVSTVGVIVGALLSALATRSFRWEGFAGTQDTAHHLVGAVLMGVGGVTAMGCTVGQGLSGLSTLALGSFLAFAGIVAGAVVGLKYQVWQLERSL